MGIQPQSTRFERWAGMPLKLAIAPRILVSFGVVLAMFTVLVAYVIWTAVRIDLDARSGAQWIDRAMQDIDAVRELSARRGTILGSISAGEDQRRSNALIPELLALEAQSAARWATIQADLRDRGLDTALDAATKSEDAWNTLSRSLVMMATQSQQRKSAERLWAIEAPANLGAQLDSLIALSDQLRLQLRAQRMEVEGTKITHLWIAGGGLVVLALASLAIAVWLAGTIVIPINTALLRVEAVTRNLNECASAAQDLGEYAKRSVTLNTTCKGDEVLRYAAEVIARAQAAARILVEGEPPTGGARKAS